MLLRSPHLAMNGGMWHFRRTARATGTEVDQVFGRQRLGDALCGTTPSKRPAPRGCPSSAYARARRHGPVRFGRFSDRRPSSPRSRQPEHDPGALPGRRSRHQRRPCNRGSADDTLDDPAEAVGRPLGSLRRATWRSAVVRPYGMVRAQRLRQAGTVCWTITFRFLMFTRNEKVVGSIPTGGSTKVQVRLFSEAGDTRG